MWHRSDTFTTHFCYTSQKKSPWKGRSVTLGAKLLWQPRAESHWWTSFSKRNDLLDATLAKAIIQGNLPFPSPKEAPYMSLPWTMHGWALLTSSPQPGQLLGGFGFGPATCSISSSDSNTPSPCTCPFPGSWWKTSPANPLLCKRHLRATGAGKQAQAQAPPCHGNTLALGDALPLPSFLWGIN